MSARCDRICKTVSTTVCTVCRQTVELASFSTRNDSWKNIHFRVQSESSRLVTTHGTNTLAQLVSPGGLVSCHENFFFWKFAVIKYRENCDNFSCSFFEITVPGLIRTHFKSCYGPFYAALYLSCWYGSQYTKFCVRPCTENEKAVRK